MKTNSFAGGSLQQAERIPPGQTATTDFPVMSAGATPHISYEDWSFSLKNGAEILARWTWSQFSALCQTRQIHDLHCYTKWSKLDTRWTGVLIDDVFSAAALDPPTNFVLAHSFDGYSTNVPTGDLVGAKAMVALRYDDKLLAPDHGGPARLLVPHLYLWKSVKWVSGLQFTARDEPAYWELRGAHMYGDPWREQRNAGD